MRLLSLVLLFALTATASAQEYIFDVQVSGSGGQDLILLPCYGCSGEEWNETVAELKDQYRCHVLTMPGFAGVEPVEAPMYQKMTEEVYRYVRQEKLDNPVAIGHSIGAHQALYVQVVHPGTFSKIIVVDALPFLAADDNPEITSDSVKVDEESMANFYKNISPEKYREMAESNTRVMVDNQEKVDEIVSWIMESDPYTYGYVYAEFMKIDLRQEMADIKCPVLLLSAKGYGDERTKEVWEQQYKLLENKQLKVNSNANHFIMYDDLDWMIKHIKSFLNE